MKYYEASVTGAGLAERVSASLWTTTPPVDMVTGRTYTAERQNFANWFTYYRRREFVAKYALADVIKNLADVTSRHLRHQPESRRTARAGERDSGRLPSRDNTRVLLDLLYPSSPDGGTPLKEGLHTVGNFFESNTGTIGGVSGPQPYDATGQAAACRQSFTVILTDGYYSDPDFRFGGNADGDNGEPYADSVSDTLADIAMYYYETDLNALANQVPGSKYDKATHQHMATYAVAFGVAGSLNPADYNESFHHKTTDQLVQWPTFIGERTPEAIDDLWHATVNGRGKFYNAANPQELATALTELMNAISVILTASSSSVTVNGDYLYGKLGPDTLIYQATYTNQDFEWTGDVKAYPVDTVTGEVLITDPHQKGWSAAEKLEIKDMGPAPDRHL